MVTQSYEGGCQCRAVRYKVEADLDKLITCNCSRCRPLGMLISFVGEDAFELQSGKEALTEYLFNRNQVHHLFCSTCGVQSFATGDAPGGGKMVAINARCLDGVDPTTLSPKAVDGASF